MPSSSQTKAQLSTVTPQRWEPLHNLLRKQPQPQQESPTIKKRRKMKPNQRMSLIVDCADELDCSPVSNSSNGVLTHLGGCNMDSLVTLQNQVVSVGDFMKQAAQAPVKMQLVWGNSQTLLMVQLKKRKDAANASLEDISTTTVDSSWFETGPLERLGVSGGTAPFFKLHLTPTGQEEAALRLNKPHMNTSYFIGKDLSHAQDEQEFYEQMLKIQMQGGEEQGVGLLSPFLFDYLGVLEDKPSNRQLLVLQNLRNQYKSFRMLDLKMGAQTAQGGWQGKPHINAWKQNLLDGMTNSAQEGYRLEGFDGCHRRINTSDPIMDVLVKAYKSRTALLGRALTDAEIKRTTRVMLQTLQGADIFRYFMDLHLEQQSSSDGEEQYKSVEVQEIVLHELVSQLVSLAVACHKVQVPQKWIGSSVALGYDAGLFPSRNDLLEEAEDTIRSKVIVKVFDWGRSELLTQQRFQEMSKTEQTDRQKFWDSYVHGVENLAYNAARSYYHHFTNSYHWTELHLQVMNFDTQSEIGHVTLSLPNAVPGQMLCAGHYKLKNYAETSCGRLRLSISWLELPGDSRLQGTWRVTFFKATDLPSVGKNLPGVDLATTSTLDTYCQVTARCENGRELVQSTKVHGSSVNPEWNETIDVPVVRHSSPLARTLMDQGLLQSCRGEKELADLFALGEPDIAEWSERLEEAAAYS